MEKKNTSLIVLVVILSILVVGLGTIVIYDKALSNKNTKVDNQENENVPNNLKKEELWLNDTLVQDLYSMVTFPGNDILGNWYFYENEKITLDNINNDTKLWMAYTRLREYEIISEYDSGYHVFSYFDITKFDNGMKDIFGNNITYTKDNFMPDNCDCEYKYNSDKNRYECIIGGCGGPISQYIDSKLYKAFKLNDEIILYEKFAFINIDEIIYANSSIEDEIDTKAGIYKDVKSEKLIKSWVKDIDYTDNNEPDYKFEDYIDQMSMVKYIFKKGNDNSYHFYSSEIVEDF